jgi:hypothetical protein
MVSIVFYVARSFVLLDKALLEGYLPNGTFTERE